MRAQSNDKWKVALCVLHWRFPLPFPIHYLVSALASAHPGESHELVLSSPLADGRAACWINIKLLQAVLW